MWDSVTRRLQDEVYGVLRLLDPLVVFDWAAGGIADLRAALRAVLNERAVERSALCGNSLGALVALDFARHHPDRVESVVASGAPGLEPELNLGIRVPRRATPGARRPARGKAVPRPRMRHRRHGPADHPPAVGAAPCGQGLPRPQG